MSFRPAFRRQSHLLWETADVIIKRVGDEAWAVKMDTREVIARGTDHSSVFQKAIDEIGAGVVFVGRGTYKVNIQLRDNIVLVGSGRGFKGTVLVPADPSLPVIRAYDGATAGNVVIRDLFIYNPKEDKNGIGIKADFWHSVIENVRVMYFKHGIWFQGFSEKATAVDNLVTGCRIGQCKIGIEFSDYGTDNMVIGNVIAGCDIGILILAWAQIVMGNFFYANGDCIRAENASTCFFIGNRFIGNSGHGLVISHTSGFRERIVVMGNIFLMNEAGDIRLGGVDSERITEALIVGNYILSSNPVIIENEYVKLYIKDNVGYETRTEIPVVLFAGERKTYIDSTGIKYATSRYVIPDGVKMRLRAAYLEASIKFWTATDAVVRVNLKRADTYDTLASVEYTQGERRLRSGDISSALKALPSGTEVYADLEVVEASATSGANCTLETIRLILELW